MDDTDERDTSSSHNAASKRLRVVVDEDNIADGGNGSNGTSQD